MRNVKMIFLILAMLLFVGCSQDASVKGEGEYYIYYTNFEVTGLLNEIYAAQGSTAEELIPELLGALNREPEETTHFLLLSDTVYVENYTYDGSMVTLYMSKAYGEMPNTREVLVRAGLVRTLVQIEAVDSVQIYVGGIPLKDSKGNDIGPMKARTFIENSGKEINSYKATNIKLYFTNAEGNRLVPESRSLYYSSNVPLEQIIVEQLILGPKAEGSYPTLPSTASVLTVMVVDDVCYVNVNKAFLEQPLSIQQEIPIYSISQSLIENCKVSKVQITVEGETELVFRESMQLNQLYEKNNALVLEEAQ